MGRKVDPVIMVKGVRHGASVGVCSTKGVLVYLDLLVFVSIESFYCFFGQH